MDYMQASNSSVERPRAVPQSTRRTIIVCMFRLEITSERGRAMSRAVGRNYSAIVIVPVLAITLFLTSSVPGEAQNNGQNTPTTTTPSTGKRLGQIVVDAIGVIQPNLKS